MKLAFLSLAVALLAPFVASAQTTPPIVQGPPYIARAQVVTVGSTLTLTAPALKTFPLDVFIQQDLGTIAGDGTQTVISTTPWTQFSFDPLDAQHASKTITWTSGGVTYGPMPYTALVNGLNAMVQQELTPPAPPASAKAK